VISSGNLVEGIKEKDNVYYDKHAGHGVQYKDTLYQVIRDIDVVLMD
jgi:co-chaperonin GroES (HSP10)